MSGDGMKKEKRMKADRRTNDRRATRRAMLRGLGASALALPFLRSFEASAQAAQPKLLVFASPTGFMVGPNDDNGVAGWFPSALQGSPRDGEVAAPDSLPPIFQPLERHKDDLLFLGGLRGVNTVGAHEQAAAILTGVGVYNDEPSRSGGGDGDWTADGISIDQLIAERIGSRVLGLSYRIEGFQLGEGRISYLGPDQPMTPIQSATTAFERVSGTGSPSDPSVVQRVLRRRSVLDRIAGDLGRIRGSVAAADRARLDQHLESVRAVEADLMAPSTSCADGTCGIGSYDALAEANIPRLIRDYSCTMTHALSCGYTRVGFIQIGNLEGNHRPQWPEFSCESSFRDHAIAHKFAGEDGAGSDGLAISDARQLGVRLQVVYNTLFADLLDRLAAARDTDGSRLLDNTVVVHIKPMGMNHDRDRLMWIVAGGRNLGIRGGRFVRYRDGQGPFVNDLHTRLCHLMGQTDVSTFGRASLNAGPLDLS
ncbi:MAG: DUF1552 domain-containing protein [Sandaracinaceae bacterium]